MKNLDQKEGSESLGDVMVQRLKNRERQRRYRERKRMLESDNVTSSRSLDLDFTEKEAEPESNNRIKKRVTRVYCGRNWKKDARMAHVVKVQDRTADSCCNQSMCLQPSVDVEVREVSEKPTALANCETRKIWSGRRDWKADARNKKH